MDAGGLPNLLEAAITGFAMLGGTMATASGLLAIHAFVKLASPGILAHRINVGIAFGFFLGAPVMLGTFIMVLVS